MWSEITILLTLSKSTGSAQTVPTSLRRRKCKEVNIPLKLIVLSLEEEKLLCTNLRLKQKHKPIRDIKNLAYRFKI